MITNMLLISKSTEMLEENTIFTKNYLSYFIRKLTLFLIQNVNYVLKKSNNMLN